MVEPQKTILVVDDDPDVRDYMASVLEQGGFHVIQAPDGEVALELVQRPEGIDLLLTDIRMPRLDGLELARRVASLKPALKVLFISGYASEFAAGTLDISRLIIKPVRPRDLVRRVIRVLDG